MDVTTENYINAFWYSDPTIFPNVSRPIDHSERLSWSECIDNARLLLLDRYSEIHACNRHEPIKSKWWIKEDWVRSEIKWFGKQYNKF